jgi:hypothetical protein
VGRHAGRIALVLIAAIGLYVFAPTTLAVLGAFPKVKTLEPWWLVAMAASQSASVWCLWQLQAVAIGTEDRFAIATSQLAGGALGRIIPGGAATASAAQYGMIAASTDDDVRRSAVATGLGMATVLQVAGLCALPIIALPAVLFGLHVPNTFAHTMILGLSVFVGMAGATIAVNKSEALLRGIGRLVYRVGHRLPRWDPPANLPDRLVAHRDDARARLGERLPTAVLATVGRWLFDLLTLISAVIAVGGHASLWLVILAFFTAQLLGQIPLTPGGIGVVEAGLTATLVAAGLALPNATLATLAYRMFNYGLMLPAGLIAWIAHRRRIAREGRVEFDPDQLWR